MGYLWQSGKRIEKWNPRRKANTEDQAATGLGNAKLNVMPGQGCCAKCTKQRIVIQGLFIAQGGRPV